MEEKTRIRTQELEQIEYMTKAEYASDAAGVVKQARQAEVSTISNDSLRLGTKPAGDYAQVSTVNSLIGLVGTAQDTANSARNTADAADEKATAAQIAANNAQETAQAAQQTADSAMQAAANAMQKEVYDTNNNGIVDNAEKLNNQPSGFYLHDHSAQKYYVSTMGNDESGDGSAEKPYRTVKAAIYKIPSNKALAPINIHVAAGNYPEYFQIQAFQNITIKGENSSNTILSTTIYNDGLLQLDNLRITKKITNMPSGTLRTSACVIGGSGEILSEAVNNLGYYLVGDLNTFVSANAGIASYGFTTFYYAAPGDYTTIENSVAWGFHAIAGVITSTYCINNAQKKYVKESGGVIFVGGALG